MNIETPRTSHIPALRNLWQEAFGDTDEYLNSFFMTAFHAERCRCVTLDGQIAAALYCFDCLHQDKPVAYLYSVATAKAYRGRGICHMLMKNTHQYLTGLGYEGSILVPGTRSLFTLYESMGYQTCSYIREFHCIGNTKQVPLHRIDKHEYARLRRRFLPNGGVVQEKENLDFLQTQAAFYAGPNFLLAAVEKDNTLYSVELLGNTTAAPEIVHTLGCEKGTFRTPGDAIPFAMYHPLGSNNLLPPAYFGLAFD